VQELPDRYGIHVPMLRLTIETVHRTRSSMT
jgi:hypothetical protein